MDLPTKLFRLKILTQKNGFDRFAQFCERLIGRMLDIIAGKAAQDRLGICRSQTQGCGIFDHLVIVVTDQFPIDSTIAEYWLQVGEGIKRPWLSPVEPLRPNIFEARQQAEAQE